MTTSDPTICDMCHRLVGPGEGYVVDVAVYADPELPPTSAGELAATDFDAEVGRLIEEMAGRSAAELQDDVHRRMRFALCRPCQRRFLENPMPPR